MHKVIERCSLDLKFESEFLLECDGLLLHDYKPCDYECKCDNGCRCNEGYETLIGLRINGDKIECVYLRCDSTWQHCFLPQASLKNAGVH